MNITVTDCIDWGGQALLHKYTSILPPKISIKFNGGCFFNTMPVLFPESNRFGVKVVSRYPSREPSLRADIMLYDTHNGELLAIMDGTWITAMRTGAVAALTIDLLKKKSVKSYSFMGLGNVARAALLCLNAIVKNEPMVIKLLKYKEQHIDFMNRFSVYKNISFELYESNAELFGVSDVIISGVTVADSNFSPDDNYPAGVLIVPIHTKGFQNCDLFFDKIYCDDIDHIKDFKYFNQYKNCVEITNVLLGKNDGRTSDDERIIVYNIGIALQDVFFASKIYDRIENKQEMVSLQSAATAKYWI